MTQTAKLDAPSDRVGDIKLLSFAVTYDYPVAFTHGAFDPDNRCLLNMLTRREPAKRHRCAVFVDDGVISAMPDLADRIARYAAVHADHIEMTKPLVTVAGGEICKNDPGTMSRLLANLSEQAIDRHSFAIAIGGGAVLDAVGYAAAIFHRGVRHVRFPTTVLSQCDSGVGVKNAVNANGRKNLLGTFAPPWAIINDGNFIDPLPPREKRAGMSEAVKVALIRNRNFFNWLENNAAALARFSAVHLGLLIRDSAGLHMRQISRGGDPFEVGSARPLDFGHWAAHRLEYLTGHELSHGEAVAIGVVLDTRYSVVAGLLAKGEDERVLRLLRRLGFVLWHDMLKQRDSVGRLSLLQGLTDFQEHLGGELTITLLAEIGRGVEVHEMDSALIAGCIDWLEQRA